MQQPIAISQDLVLLGGGHAHVHVLKSLGMRPPQGVRVTLVARDVETPYSGMLPGYVAGHYPFAACHIDLGRLARFAGARLVHDEAISLDRAAGHVLCRAHPPIRYDLLSLDIGSMPRADVPGAVRHTIAVKPIDRFARHWEALLARARGLDRLRLAVVGAGAGGVELALSAEHRLRPLIRDGLHVTLVTREALLPSHNRRVARRFAHILTERGITLLTDSAVACVEPDELVCADGSRIGFDEALWVTEAGAASWLAETGLPLDPGGFVMVDETLRSVGDPHVFAAGDVAAIRGHPRAKAGVFAVRAGPPLAVNLRRALADLPLRRAVPQRRALALIGTGDARAVASRGGLVAEGRWVWQLKDRIDRRWMRRYQELPAMAEADEDEMRCGGCAAKVPAPVLGRALARVQPRTNAAVALGLLAPDDAAVVQFPGAPPLLQTVDFFRAMVGDPYLFGRIAANHALGDIYAMGGMPETALAIATLPPARPAIVEHDLFHMLKGGLDVLEPAGAVLVGGHSAEGAEMALGFAVTGRPPPQPHATASRGDPKEWRLLRKSGLAPGQRLILTKPLGTGVILAGEARGLVPSRLVAAAIATMLQGAAPASACLIAHRAAACTDVTGFGLLGHLLEMLSASGVDAVIDPATIPALDGALDLFARGIASSLAAANQAALMNLEAEQGREKDPLAALLIDPQTAGGLLAGVPAECAAACLAELAALGYRAAEIGVIVPLSSSAPRVRLESGCLDAPAPRPAAAVLP